MSRTLRSNLSSFVKKWKKWMMNSKMMTRSGVMIATTLTTTHGDLNINFDSALSNWITFDISSKTLKHPKIDPRSYDPNQTFSYGLLSGNPHDFFCKVKCGRLGEVNKYKRFFFN
mmetsp:Transcript_35023/g.65378  ORF Transcript_35023/g.65378 Transcript_35023/m.65378 type:complete len:115 (-) Transcript_35023:3-347(-)